MQISTQSPRPSQRYQASPNQTNYSEEGQLLAELSRDSYDSARGEWRSVRKLAADGLRKIRDAEGSTADEKALARMGLDIGGDYMHNDDAARMQRAVLGNLASAVPGPVGMVLAQTALNAYDSTALEWKVARGVVQDGLEAVAGNERTSDSERDLANLGLTLGSGYQYNDEAARIQKTVLRTIAQGTEGDMPQVLARTTLKARNENSFREWKAVRSLETRGLRAVLNHEASSDYDKTIAALGADFGDDHMYNDDAGKIQRVVLEELASPGSGNISYEVARVTKRAYHSGIRYETGRKILREAFDTILARPDASESQKTMAQMGVDVGKEHMTDQESCRRRMNILDKLINLG